MFCSLAVQPWVRNINAAKLRELLRLFMLLIVPGYRCEDLSRDTVKYSAKRSRMSRTIVERLDAMMVLGSPPTLPHRKMRVAGEFAQHPWIGEKRGASGPGPEQHLGSSEGLIPCGGTMRYLGIDVQLTWSMTR